jgi:hypothetical protein
MTMELSETPATSQAPERETLAGQGLFHSPIQEQHIDFLLEEEFACNQAFLHFFLKEARKNILAPLECP